MSTPTRDKIIGYLANDISPTVTASACGVTPAYVSQLLELAEVREEIATLKAAKLEKALQSDETVDSLEVKALQMVEKRLPFVRTAVEAVKIAATLNGMKRKAAPTHSTEDVLNAAQVMITVPRGASLMFRLNDTNQVTEVEGRTMAPLPSRSLPALQRQITNQPVTDVQVIPTITPQSFQEKQQQQDSVAAKRVLRDLTMVLDGVVVVI